MWTEWLKGWIFRYSLVKVGKTVPVAAAKRESRSLDAEGTKDSGKGNGHYFFIKPVLK